MIIYPSVITHEGVSYDIVRHEADTLDHLDESRILKVHAICVHNNNAVLVNHAQWNIWGLPGGTREVGETHLETLAREIQEETNCALIRAVPISYEVVLDPAGNEYYRAHYYCVVEPIDEFISDCAGAIDQITWVPVADIPRHIEQKDHKQAVIQRVIRDWGRYCNY